MRFSRHGNDASWRGLNQQIGQQLNKVEMWQMIRLERCLKAIVSQRVRQAKHTGVENENIQRTTETQRDNCITYQLCSLSVSSGIIFKASHRISL